MNTIKKGKRKTKEIRNFEIIKSNFSPNEAVEIISEIIHNKISFHTLKILQSKEYTGKTDKFSEKRVRELRKILKEIKNYCLKYDKSKYFLKVNALLTIEASKRKE